MFSNFGIKRLVMSISWCIDLKVNIAICRREEHSSSESDRTKFNKDSLADVRSIHVILAADI